ncbi:MAG: hypothetical protein V5A28_05960 [Haloarculaceae archaeon]
MSDRGTDSGGIALGRIAVGVLSVVGAIAVVLSTGLSVLEYQQLSGRVLVDLVVRFPLSYVGFPGVVAVFWFVVGAVLLVGHSLSVQAGAVAYLGAVVLNIGVVVAELLRVRPVFLWFVDPVTPLVAIPLQLVQVAGVPLVTYPVEFYVTGVVGTAGTLLVGGYLGVRALLDATS